LLTAEELEIAHAEWDAEVIHIADLYRQARRESNQVRARALFELAEYVKHSEREFFSEQDELQKAADEALPPTRRRPRKSVVKTA
jgi:hypothetical protein